MGRSKMKRTKFLVLIALGLSLIISAITRGVTLVPITAAYAAQSAPILSSPGHLKLDGITCAACHEETTHVYLSIHASWINLPAYSSMRSQILAGSPGWHYEPGSQDGTVNTDAIYTVLIAHRGTDQAQMDGQNRQRDFTQPRPICVPRANGGGYPPLSGRDRAGW